MADTIARLNVVCGATDNASGVLGGITASLGKLMAVGALVGTMAFIGKKSIDSFVAFDTAVTNSLAMFEGFGEGLRGEMESVSRSLSKELGYSAEEVAGAFYYLGSAGLSLETSLAAIEPVTRFAMAANIDLEQAADVATIAMKAFGNTADELPHTLDVLVNTVRNTNTNMSQLADAFSYVAPTAASFGMSVEEVSAALGMMANMGIKGSQAGTALRRIITNLVAPTGQAAQAIEALNLQVYETGSSGNTLISSISACQSEMDQYQMIIDSATDALLGLEDAQRGFSISMQESELEIMKIRDQAADENRDLTSSEMSRIEQLESKQRDLRISMAENRLEQDKLIDQQKDAEIQAEAITGEISGYQEQLEASGGEMRDFGSILEDIVRGTENMTEAEKNATLTMLAGVRGISGLIAMLEDGGSAYQGFVTDAEAADGVVKEMSEYMSTSAGVKIAVLKQQFNDLAIMLGEKLLPVALKLANFFVNTMLPALKNLYENSFIKEFVAALSSLINQDWEGFKTHVKNVLGDRTFWSTLLLGVPGLIIGVFWDEMVEAVRTADWGHIAKVIVMGIVYGIYELVSYIYDGFKNLLKDGIAAWGDWWEESGKPWFLDLPSKILNALGNVGSWLYNKGKDILQGLIDGLLDAVPGLRTAVNTIVNVIGGIIDKVMDALYWLGVLKSEQSSSEGTGIYAPTVTPGEGITGGTGIYGTASFDDFILSGGNAFEFNPRDTIIGVKQPEQLVGGKNYTINQNLYFQNVADEQYIHKIGSMVERSLRRVVA